MTKHSICVRYIFTHPGDKLPVSVNYMLDKTEITREQAEELVEYVYNNHPKAEWYAAAGCDINSQYVWTRELTDALVNEFLNKWGYKCTG